MMNSKGKAGTSLSVLLKLCYVSRKKLSLSHFSPIPRHRNKQLRYQANKTSTTKDIDN